MLERLLQGPPAVLSTGGGAFMGEANRAMIADRGAAVWLRADLETLWQRVRGRGSRPLLKTPDPRRTLADLLAAREDTYALARIVVDSRPGISVDRMARLVQDALAGHPDILDPPHTGAST